MVYLKQYLQFLKEGNDINHNYNAEVSQLVGIFDKLGLQIEVSSHSSRYNNEEEDHENYTDINMNWYLKAESIFKKNSGMANTYARPLRILADFISDGVMYPMFADNELNDALFDDNITKVNICIGIIGEDKSNIPNPFFNMVGYRDRTQIRKNVLSVLLHYWEETTGDFKSKFDDKIIHAPYISKLVTSYIKYVIANDKAPNYEELAEMIVESLVHSEDAYRIIQEFKERNSYLYLTMKSINPNVDDQLANMGF